VTLSLACTVGVFIVDLAPALVVAAACLTIVVAAVEFVIVIVIVIVSRLAPSRRGGD
jgi:hypothetical protein